MTKQRALGLLDSIITDAQLVPMCGDDEGWNEIEEAVRQTASNLGRVSLRAAGLLANIRKARKAEASRPLAEKAVR